jgi:ankyrin repeat protein
MNKKLPERPNLDQLKKQAKDLLADIRAQRPEALARVPQNELAAFALADAQRILAREHGFPSWTKLKERVELSGPALAARALIHASLQGKADKVDTILREHPRLSRVGINVAAVLGDPTGVRDWIRHDPALATKVSGESNWTPLLSACVGRVGGDDASRADCVRQLLAAGANANDYWIEPAFPKAKLPALYGATGINNYPQTARVLLAAGANPNDGESVYHAAEHNHGECLAALLEAGADLGQRNEQWKNTPLYFLVGHVPGTQPAPAARAGIVWLLEHGANPNIPAYDFAEVPLFGVIRNSWDAALAETFLRHGADPDARRKDGLSLMAFATRHGRDDIAALLAQHGAPRTVAPLDEFLGALAHGDTGRARAWLERNPAWPKAEPVPIAAVVFGAAKRGDTGPLNSAAALGLEVNRVDEKGETPLHYAALNGRVDAVRRLLELGADHQVRDKTYQAPPLGWCVHGSIHFRSAGGDYPAVAEALLAAGAEMIPIPREQLSPEMLAVFDRYKKTEG